METIKEIDPVIAETEILKPGAVTEQFGEISRLIAELRTAIDTDKITGLTLTTSSDRKWHVRWWPASDGTMSLAFHIVDSEQSTFTYNRVTYTLHGFRVSKDWNGQIRIDPGYMHRVFTDKALIEFRSEMLPMVEEVWETFKNIHSTTGPETSAHFGPYIARLNSVWEELGRVERAMYLTKGKISDLSKPTSLDSRRL